MGLENNLFMQVKDENRNLVLVTLMISIVEGIANLQDHPIFHILNIAILKLTILGWMILENLVKDENS